MADRNTISSSKAAPAARPPAGGCVDWSIRGPGRHGRSPGMVIHVVTDHPAAPLDPPAWCHLAGRDCLGPVASPLGPACAIRLTAVTKPSDERWPWVRRA